MQFLSLFESNWYTDIGHTPGSEAWVLTGSRIQKEKVLTGGSRAEIHRQPGIKAKGRIDHEKLKITLVGDDEEAVEYCKDVFSKKYPKYKVVTLH